MTNEKTDKKSRVNYRQVTERFCATIGDNVVVMQTVTEDSVTLMCLSAEGCPNSHKCKNNI